MSASRPHASLPLPETDEQQAPFLAGLLRASRLTVLYGEAGAGKTRLLRHGMLPLLRRRLVERPARRALRLLRQGAPAPADAAAAAADALDPEVGVFFDGWSVPPWAALQTLLRDALAMPAAMAPSPLGMAQTLATWAEDREARLLIVLDRFEECLLGAAQRPDLKVFADELVRAVNRPDLPVNFLVALRDEAEPLMARLCHRIPGFDPHRLELRPAAPGDGVRRLAALEPARPRADDDGAEALARAQREAAWTSSRTAEVYASIDSMLARTAAARGEPAFALSGGGRDAVARHAPWPEPPVLLDAEPCEAAPARPDDEDDEAPERPAQPAARGWPRKSPYWLGLPAVLAGLLFLLEPAGEPDGGVPAPAQLEPPVERRARSDRDMPAAPAPAEERLALAPATAVPPPVPAPTAGPALQLAVDLDAATDLRMARELAQGMADGLAKGAAPGIEVLPSVDRTATLAALGAGAGLAVLRYDALQAARAQRPAAALEVVTPLYSEAIGFLVRADSPLRFIHEIENSRINTGPAESAGALTAAAVYRRLFDKALPAAQADRLAPDAALQSLLAGRGLDVMLSVGAPPADWFAHARGLRLLELDPGHPASRRALRAFLPARAGWGDAPAAADTPTLGVMSFLVAAAGSGDDALLGRFAAGLCQALPALRREGDPKWRQLRPGQQLDVGWPYSQAAAQGFHECTSSSSATKER